MSQRPSLVHSTLLLTAVGLASQGFGFLYRILMARLVGAEVLGLYQLIMPAFSVAQSICVAGLALSVSVLSSEYQARHNGVALRQLVHTALWGMALLWLPVAFTVLTQSQFISRRLLGDGRTRLGLVLLLPVLLLTGIENLQKQHFYGIGAVKIPAGVELGEKFIQSLSIILLLLLFAPQKPSLAVALIVVGWLISELFSAGVLTLFRLRRPVPAGGSRIPPAELRKRLWNIAFPVSLTALAGNLMSAATSVLIPRLLVSYGLSASEAMESFGILLGMTLPLLMVPTAFINGLTLALLPRLTEERELGHMGEFRATSQKAMRSVSYGVLPLIALLAALGPDLGVLLFAQARVGDYILPLAAAVGCSCWRGVLGCMLNALGKQRQSAAVSLACGGVELILTLYLTPRAGLGGFVFAFTATEVLGTVLCLRLAQKQAGMTFGFFRCFAAPVLAALLAGALVRLGYALLVDGGMFRGWAMALCALLGLLIYHLSMLAQGIRPLAFLGRGGGR